MADFVGGTVTAVTKASLVTARDAIAKLCFDAKIKSINKRVPRNMISRLVSEHNKKHRGLNLTIKMVHSVVTRRYSSETLAVTSSTEEESESDIECPQLLSSNHRGRPKGTSFKGIRKKKDLKTVLLNEITTSCKLLKAEHAPKRVPVEEFDCLITETKQKHGIARDDKYFAMRKKLVFIRLQRGNPVYFVKGPMSPALHLELALVGLLTTLADMNKPLTFLGGS